MSEGLAEIKPRTSGFQIGEKLKRICLRIPCLLLALYTFVCSLDVLSMSFRLMAGRTAGI
jgi:hypothetical protein